MKILFLSVLIVCLSGLGFAEGFKGTLGSEYDRMNLDTDAQKLVSADKYEESDLRLIDELSFRGYNNLAFDICDRIRKMSVDEDFLKLVKIHQTVALVRMWVEIGFINSITQIPFESLGISNCKSTFIDYYEVEMDEKRKNELKEKVKRAILNPGSDEEIGEIPPEVTIYNYEEIVEKELEGRTENFWGYLPEEYADSNYTFERKLDTPAEELESNHAKLLSKVCTIELMEKYPMAVEKLYNDYVGRYGYDNMTEIMVNYFMNKEDYKKAINLCDLFLQDLENKKNKFSFEERDLKILKSISYAKMKDIETSIGIINKELDKAYSEKYGHWHIPDLYYNKILIYKYAGTEDEYKENIENIENELAILNNEKPKAFEFSYHSYESSEGYVSAYESSKKTFESFYEHGTRESPIADFNYFRSGKESTMVTLAEYKTNKIR